MNRLVPPRGIGSAAGLTETDAVSRLAMIIRNTKLDCDCKLGLDETMARFVALERRRMVRRGLLEARARRDRIEAFLEFLKELDDLDVGETDPSVHREMMILFEDIADAAQQGAELMRQLSPPPSM